MGLTKSNQLTIDGGIKLPVDIFELLEIDEDAIDTSISFSSPLSNDEIYNRIMKNRQNGFTYYDGNIGSVTYLGTSSTFKYITIFMGTPQFDDNGMMSVGSACKLDIRLENNGTNLITAYTF